MFAAHSRLLPDLTPRPKSQIELLGNPSTIRCLKPKAPCRVPQLADHDQPTRDAAKNPKAVAVDGPRVDAQSVDDLIKSDQQLVAGRGAVGNAI